MKKAVLLIILLLAVNLASASSIFLRDILYEGETKLYKTDDGMYVLELLIVSDSAASSRFRLNNEQSSTLSKGDDYLFSDGSQVVVNSITPNEADEGLDEVNIYFYGSGKSPIHLTNPKEFNTEEFNVKNCNFDGQCKNETRDECCYDCGCKVGSRCIDNECIRAEECSKNNDCADGNACTEEECVESNCIYTKLEGCGLGDTCISIGYSTIDSYCGSEGWQRLKVAKEPCNNDYECISSICRGNICKKPGIVGKIIAVIALIMLIIAIILVNQKGLVLFKGLHLKAWDMLKKLELKLNPFRRKRKIRFNF